MLTQSQVRDLFTYDPNTGIFCRANKPKAKPFKSNFVRYKKKSYMVTRLIYVYMLGEHDIPANIMRIDKDQHNNRWNNFTWASPHQKSAQTRTLNGFKLTPELVHKIFDYDAETDTLTTKHPTNPVTVTSKKLNLGGNIYTRARIVYVKTYL